MGNILVINGVDFSSVAVNIVTPVSKVLIEVVASPNNGGIVMGNGLYNEGESVQIAATSKPGYNFKQWNEGNTNATRTITVGSQNQTYTAIFEDLLEELIGDSTIIGNTTQATAVMTSSELKITRNGTLSSFVLLSNYNAMKSHLVRITYYGSGDGSFVMGAVTGVGIGESLNVSTLSQHTEFTIEGSLSTNAFGFILTNLPAGFELTITSLKILELE